MHDREISLETRYQARRLSLPMRELLIEHAKGPQKYIAHHTTFPGLFRKGLLKFTSPGNRQTTLTELGRHVVCFLLAEYADAITSSRAFMENLGMGPMPSGDEIERARLAPEKIHA